MDASTPWSADRLLIDPRSQAAISTRNFLGNGPATVEYAGIWSIRGLVGYRNPMESPHRIQEDRRSIDG
jgi:hypothetical protein